VKVIELKKILEQIPDQDEVIILDADTGGDMTIYYAGKDIDQINKNSQNGFCKEDITKDTVYLVSNYWSM